MNRPTYTPEELKSITERVLADVSSIKRERVSLSFLIGKAVEQTVPEARWPQSFRKMYKHEYAYNLPFGEFGLKIRELVLSSPLIIISDRDSEYLQGFGDYRDNSVAIALAAEPMTDGATFCRDMLEAVLAAAKDVPDAEKRKISLMIDLAKLLEHNPKLDDRQVAQSFSFLVGGARHLVRE